MSSPLKSLLLALKLLVGMAVNFGIVKAQNPVTSMSSGTICQQCSVLSDQPIGISPLYKDEVFVLQEFTTSLNYKRIRWENGIVDIDEFTWPVITPLLSSSYMDIDGDGNDDIVGFPASNPNSLVVYYFEGNDGISQISELNYQIAPNSLLDTPNARRIRPLSSIEGSGFFFVGEQNIYFSGPLQPNQTITFQVAAQTGFSEYSWTDLNNDNLLDLVSYSPLTEELLWLRNLGNGNLSEVEVYLNPPFSWPATLIDLTGDGLSDLVWLEGNGEAARIHGGIIENGLLTDTIFSGQSNIGEWLSLNTGGNAYDLNHDGADELVFGNGLQWNSIDPNCLFCSTPIYMNIPSVGSELIGVTGELGNITMVHTNGSIITYSSQNEPTSGCSNPTACNYSTLSQSDADSCCSGSCIIVEIEQSTLGDSLFDFAIYNSVEELIGSIIPTPVFGRVEQFCLPDDCYSFRIYSGTGTLNLYSNTVGNPLILTEYFDASQLGSSQYWELEFSLNGSCGPIEGCTDPLACNFDPQAAIDSGTCSYPNPAYLDCNGNCVTDTDGDGVCDEDEILGCLDSSACNFNPLATDSDQGVCFFATAVYDCQGNCQEDTDGDGICDQNENANGSQFCGLGTVWDPLSSTCVSNSLCLGDLNNDNIISINDLLILLANFGSVCID